jgi:hypothetical protein
MSVTKLYDRRTPSDRRAQVDRRRSTRTGARRASVIIGGPTRRQIWIALVLYCTAFWGVVGYAIYDIFAR